MNAKNHNLISFLLILIFISVNLVASGQQRFFQSHMSSGLELTAAKDFNFSLGKFHNRIGYFNENFPYYNLNGRDFSNLQIAYSPANHLGVSFHYSKIKFKSEIYAPFYRIFQNTNRHLGLDIGGYHSIKFQLRRKKKRRPPNRAKYKKILFDLYSGFALGRLKNFDTTTAIAPYGSLQLHSQKLYLQGGIHWIGEVIHLSGRLRGGGINYRNAKVDGQIDQLTFEKITTLLDKSNSKFWGFSLKLEFNYKGIGVYGEMVEEYSDIDDYYYNIYFLRNFGLAFNIQQIRKHYLSKKKKNKS